MEKLTLTPGQRFGRLIVLGVAERLKGGTKWLCRCDCGSERPIYGNALNKGHTVSCGCQKREAAQKQKTHGACVDGKTAAEYSVWSGLVQRCTNPRNRAYANYGGRGITVCDRWRDSFADFLADVGPRPSVAYTIDRIDNAKGYEPGNVKWSTRQEQQNNMRTNRLLTKDGVTRTVAQWARELGMPAGRLRSRLQRGWSDEEALRG